jgi:small-conductance mechanosensitive channel
VSSKINQPWISLDKIELFVQIEPAILILGLALGAWLTSKVFLRDLSKERQRNLKTLFKNLTYHLLLGTSLFVIYFILHQLTHRSTAIERLATYVGLGTILMGSVIFVKVWRILVFEYLFLSHMRVAFPVLLVNLFTLLLSILLGAWIGAEIFSIRLTPILATSAIFSLVLGLALQDTLGNLFAGVALQFDKPYEIGDWIEIQSGGHKWIGQVYEISWRATVLISFTEESITVPNRIVASAQIANYSTKYRPIIRSQVLRLPLSVNIPQTKDILFKAAHDIHEIRKNPAPLILISETTESWVGFKIVYFIDNYGEQFVIADKVLSQCLTQLEKAGIELAHHQITIHQKEEVSILS